MPLVVLNSGSQREHLTLPSQLSYSRVLFRFKIVTIIALIIYGIVVDAGGALLKNGGYDRLAFRFWGPPYGPFGHAQGEGSLNAFLGFWSCMSMSIRWFGGLSGGEHGHSSRAILSDGDRIGGSGGGRGRTP